MFAVFNAAIIPCVWFFFPETGKRSLEEIDLIFAKAYAENINPTKMSLEMPRVKGAELDRELRKYLDHEDVENQRRASMRLQLHCNSAKVDFRVGPEVTMQH